MTTPLAVVVTPAPVVVISTPGVVATVVVPPTTKLGGRPPLTRTAKCMDPISNTDAFNSSVSQEELDEIQRELYTQNRVMVDYMVDDNPALNDAVLSYNGVKHTVRDLRKWIRFN